MDENFGMDAEHAIMRARQMYHGGFTDSAVAELSEAERLIGNDIASLENELEEGKETP